MVNKPTQGRVGGNASVNICSFPGICSDQWNTMVDTQKVYNFAVVYDTSKDEPEFLKEIMPTIEIVLEGKGMWCFTWIDASKDKWEEIKAEINKEDWFKKWWENVQIDHDAGKKMIVVRNGSKFGNYQRAEMKILRDAGIPFWINDVSTLAVLNEKIVKIYKDYDKFAGYDDPCGVRKIGRTCQMVDKELKELFSGPPS
jgi:hypothetical protein